MSELNRRTAIFARGVAAHPDLAVDAAAQARLADLKIDAIEPDPANPRRQFDEDALAELADSIRANGLLQPIIVRPGEGGRHFIIAGERRWRAARLAGFASIKAIVRPALQDAVTLLFAQIAENEAREPLTTRELVDAVARLSALGSSQKDIAARLGMAKARVAKIHALGSLPERLIPCLDTMGVDPLYVLLQHHKRDADAVLELLSVEPAPTRASISRAFEEKPLASGSGDGILKVSPEKLLPERSGASRSPSAPAPMVQPAPSRPRVTIRVRHAEHGEGRVVASHEIVVDRLPIRFNGTDRAIQIALAELAILAVE